MSVLSIINDPKCKTCIFYELCTKALLDHCSYNDYFVDEKMGNDEEEN